jgi:hypothetical protein
MGTCFIYDMHFAFGKSEVFAGSLSKVGCNFQGSSPFCGPGVIDITHSETEHFSNCDLKNGMLFN